MNAPRAAIATRTDASATPLTVIILTLNEEANIRDCLASLAAQADKRFEVLVIDAASNDNTVALINGITAGYPVPLRLHEAPLRLPIGEARNLGVRMATTPCVAFVSADAEVAPDWTEKALQGLATWDMVFGRQVHEPRGWTVGAAVRGLRYDFPQARTSSSPWRLASNVAAAYRKEVLVAHPFDDWANAAEDLLLARRAVAAGFTAFYDPALVVRHHDVAQAKVEWRKNVREGEGWAVYRAELGYLPEAILWAGLLAASATYLALRPGLVSAAAMLLALWLPALRRALRRRTEPMPTAALLLGLAASPAFDLAFLASYLRGLTARPQETRP